jgi:vacuolar-type H+-ATPase subunit I/STV1
MANKTKAQNRPETPATISKSETPNLIKLIDIKWQIEALQAQRKEIEPFATEEAINILVSSGKEKGIVLRADTGKITLARVEKRPSGDFKGFADLESLKEEYELACEEAVRNNAIAIEQIQKQMETLSAKLEKLGAQYAALHHSPKAVKSWLKLKKKFRLIPGWSHSYEWS